jgi:lysophospholipase L1-like esterase
MTCLIAVSAAMLAPLHSEQIHPVVITCLGDSVTHSYPYGTGDPYADPSKTYAGQLAALLDAEYPAKLCEVHNRGVNGYRAEHVISQLQNEELPEDPDFVLLMIGGNDLATAYDLSSFGVIVDQTVDEVQQCVDLINAHTNHDGKTPTIILSAFIPNMIAEVGGWNPNLGIRIYNGDFLSFFYADLGEIQGEDLYLKTNFTDLYDSVDGKAKADMMFDAVHPNQFGYAAMAQNWFDALVNFPPMQDTDGDGLWDEDETGYGTQPGLADSDGDGFSDMIEVACAGAAVATDETKQPAVVRVNFQPPRLVAPAGHAPEGGLSPVPGAPFGWQ